MTIFPQYAKQLDLQRTENLILEMNKKGLDDERDILRMSNLLENRKKRINASLELSEDVIEQIKKTNQYFSDITAQYEEKITQHFKRIRNAKSILAYDEFNLIASLSITFTDSSSLCNIAALDRPSVIDNETMAWLLNEFNDTYLDTEICKIILGNDSNLSLKLDKHLKIELPKSKKEINFKPFPIKQADIELTMLWKTLDQRTYFSIPDILRINEVLMQIDVKYWDYTLHHRK
jgi:hypothetical protein